MKTNIILQCFLCLFLMITGIIIGFRSNHRTAEAGAFGAYFSSNDTLEDLSFNLFEDIFHE